MSTNAWDNTITNDYAVAGIKFLLSKAAVAAGDKFTLKLYDSQLGDIADPTVNGMTVNLRVGGIDHVYNLPASGWSGGVGWYKYRQAGLVNGTRVKLPGPITKVSLNLIKGAMTIAAKGSALSAVVVVIPTAVDVRIRQPGIQQGYCAEFAGTPTTKRLAVVNRAPPHSQCPE
jgi:hypothetical protein